MYFMYIRYQKNITLHMYMYIVDVLYMQTITASIQVKLNRVVDSFFIHKTTTADPEASSIKQSH